MKQKLFLLVCTRTPGIGTACRKRKNLTFEVSSVTCIHTYLLTAWSRVLLEKLTS